MIETFNSEVDKFILKHESISNIKDWVIKDEKKIKWDDKLFNKLKKHKKFKVVKEDFRITLRTPFCKEHIYFNKDWNWSRVLLPSVFMKNQSNLIISCIGKGSSREFSVLISNEIIDYHFQQNGQCFPLYYFEKNESNIKTLFDTSSENELIKRDGITDHILAKAIKQYGKSTTKEDIFFYVYGILHSPDYRKTFENDLKKMLPRLPLLEKPKDFWLFSKAGRELAELHLNYESVAPYDKVDIEGEESQNFKVQKMTYGKIKKEIDGKNKTVADKSVIYFNSSITIKDIPEKAYEYVVNGKSAIEWIMERYQITIDKKSGIKNNPNDWADEVGNPRYILDLLLSIINVSIQTIDIVEGLPKLEFE